MDYIFHLFHLEDSIGYNCYITSSNGDTFINGNVDTILTITVIKGKWRIYYQTIS